MLGVKFELAVVFRSKRRGRFPFELGVNLKHLIHLSSPQRSDTVVASPPVRE